MLTIYLYTDYCSPQAYPRNPVPTLPLLLPLPASDRGNRTLIVSERTSELAYPATLVLNPLSPGREVSYA